MPQTIAHRGYKAKYPENTMGAFRGAVEVGAHAIETDIHLSRDGEVVLSHVRSRNRDVVQGRCSSNLLFRMRRYNDVLEKNRRLWIVTGNTSARYER